MIDDSAIRLALRGLLLTVPGLPVARAWENRAFQPPDVPTPWVRETSFPDPERQAASDVIEGGGFIEYDLIYPAGSGTEMAEAMALAVKNAFIPGQALTGIGSVVRASREPGYVWGQWYVLPVRIIWRDFSFI